MPEGRESVATVHGRAELGPGERILAALAFPTALCATVGGALALIRAGTDPALAIFGPDTDLRRFGLALSERGGKRAKKRAVIAVARKLAVLLHRLWVSGETYQPLRTTRAEARAA
jgi:hypothetical protein